MGKKRRLHIVTNEGQPANLTASEAQNLIREIAADSAHINVLRPHGEARRKQRGVSYQDIARVLRVGRLTEGPYIAIKSGNWRMNVTGQSAGEELTCVVEIEWRESVLIVTVFKA